MTSLVFQVLIMVLLLHSIHSASSGKHGRHKSGGTPSAVRIRPPPMTGDPISPDCYNFTVGDLRLQEFYSPNYPGEYLNNTDCVLYLEAPSGFRIQLDFRDHFTLEMSEDCKYDFLEVRDGPFAYSPLIDRFCGAIFPPLVESTNRFLWLRFKTDDLLEYGGFRAIYSYHKDHTQNDGTSLSKVASTVCRIPIRLDSGRLDGVMTSAEVPFGDVLDPNYPRHLPVDCTWEIIAEQGYSINLHTVKMARANNVPCDRSFVSVYEGTTLESDRRARLCGHDAPEVTSLTSHSKRVFVRLYGDTFHSKPEFRMVYTLVRTGDACAKRGFSCGDFCISPGLRCNGNPNCPGGRDERGCARGPGIEGGAGQGSRGVADRGGRGQSAGGGDNANTGTARGGSSDGGGDETREESEEEELKIPVHMIVLGAVGGVLLTCVILGLCIMCRSRRRQQAPGRKTKDDTDRARPSAKRGGSQKEMVAIPLSPSHHGYTFSGHPDSRSGAPQGHGQGQPQGRYFTFAQVNPVSKDTANRYSAGGSNNSQQPSSESGDIPDIMTDSGQFRRFLAMEVTPEHVEDGSPCTTMYNTPQGVVIGMTRLPSPSTTPTPQCPGVEGGGGYGGLKYQNQWQKGVMEDPSLVYPYNTSLPRPTPFLSMSKPYPQESKYQKSMQALKVMDEELMKETPSY